VTARIERVQAHDLVRLGESRLGRALVARLPVIDLVVLLALLVVADERRARRFGAVGARHRGQHVVVDDDRVARVLRLVAGLGDDCGHLLALETDLVGGQHSLRVAAHRRHPGQLVLGHELARHHRYHSRHAGRRARVDRLDARMGMRAAQDRHVQHVRQNQIVDVVALAVKEARVLLALDGLADASVYVCGGHYFPPPAATA